MMVKHQVSAVDHQYNPKTKAYDVQNFKFSPIHLLSGRFGGLKLLAQGLCLLFERLIYRYLVGCGPGSGGRWLETCITLAPSRNTVPQNPDSR